MGAMLNRDVYGKFAGKIAFERRTDAAPAGFVMGDRFPGRVTLTPFKYRHKTDSVAFSTGPD